MILAEFLDREVSLHSSMAKLKMDLHSRRDFNLVDAFNTIDMTQDGFLNYNNIRGFLRMNGYPTSDEEIIAIVRRLDGDAD